MAEDEARLLRLEEQTEHSGDGAWEYICLARYLHARRPCPRPLRRPSPPQQRLRALWPLLTM